MPDHLLDRQFPGFNRKVLIMRRFFRLTLHAALIIAAAIISFVIVDMEAVPGGSVGGMFNGVVAAAVGLVFGLLLAWMRGVPWRVIPTVMRAWLHGMRRQFWWAVAGCTSVAVLILY